MAITQEALGTGTIVWLGINREPRKFSESHDSVTIVDDGIVGDMYRGIRRKIKGHDVDYMATDGVKKGDLVLNHRQITIIEAGEADDAGRHADMKIASGMLRENLVVTFVPTTFRLNFSNLPAFSRMVIGVTDPKVLILTEENSPCRTICNPIAAHFKRGPKWSEQLRHNWLKGRRGQMAMVRSLDPRVVQIGDPFRIFPPMGWPFGST